MPQRYKIVSAMGIDRGQSVADIGAGTGAFLTALAEAVGPGGRVYATDISAPFVERIATRAKAGGIDWVEARLSGERSADLPANSIDKALICDVYHHFEYPRSMMNSLAKALKPDGEVILIDFERIPGVSADWILDHVRAGKTLSLIHI